MQGVNSERPLAAIMVTDPTPMTLSLISGLSAWCDIVLLEATTTTRGEPRRAQRRSWFDLTGLTRPGLRIITTDLAGGDPWHRQRIQRTSLTPLLVGEPSDRMVIMLDSDEFLDPTATLAEAAALFEPVRLRLVPHYGAIDRVARSIHCCAGGAPDALRDPDRRGKQPYLLAGPSVSSASDILRNGLLKIRYAGIRKGSPAVGSHITMSEPAQRVAWKLANMRHRWHPRVMDVRHLSTTLRAGIHHAGWWIAEYREPEPWLVQLGEAADLRECGKPLPEEHLRALRTWAELRLQPELPDGFVAMVDEYAARRPTDARDFLTLLESEVLSRPIRHRGYAADDRTTGARAEDFPDDDG